MNCVVGPGDSCEGAGDDSTESVARESGRSTSIAAATGVGGLPSRNLAPGMEMDLVRERDAEVEGLAEAGRVVGFFLMALMAWMALGASTASSMSSVSARFLGVPGGCMT